MGIGRNPAAPAEVVINQPYTITLTQTTTTHNTGYCDLFGREGTSGPWLHEASYTFSGGSTYAQHTFNVVNQDYGTYWWLGSGACSAGGTTGWSVAYGGYTTVGQGGCGGGGQQALRVASLVRSED